MIIPPPFHPFHQGRKKRDCNTVDASTDKTVEIARELGLKVFVHSKNMGYGAHQKKCYKEVLKEGEAIIAMLHPDYHYDPTLLPLLLKPIN